MKFSWLVKHRLVLFGLSIQLAAFSLFPFLQQANAAGYDESGFIIEADQVIGEGMKATLVSRETAGSKSRPMMRITYDSAEIHGMRLTKHFRTPGGTISITMKADGPVRINGMQVDTSAISFKGACIHAAKRVPKAAMEGVTMVAHSMNAADSSLEQLQLQTVNGDAGVKQPGKLKILQDLSSMPSEKMKEEIAKITSGQLPLTCELPDEEEKDPLIGGEVTKPLDPVLPIKDKADSITAPIKEVADKVSSPVKETVQPVKEKVDTVKERVIEEASKTTETVKETARKTTDTVEETAAPVTDPVKTTVKQTARTTCEKAADTNGDMTKELWLELIDNAMKENIAISQSCPNDAELTKQLKEWEEGFHDSLGLLPLETISEKELLEKMREVIAKEPDGAIIKF